MQVFMPYSDFCQSLMVLDRQRLGKQRVESWQIIDTVTHSKKAWSNHPAVLMWKDYIPALKVYYNMNLMVWEIKGYNNIKLKPFTDVLDFVYPDWLGDDRIHQGYRSQLLAKNYDHYCQFGWTEKAGEYQYYWKVA